MDSDGGLGLAVSDPETFASLATSGDSFDNLVMEEQCVQDFS